MSDERNLLSFKAVTFIRAMVHARWNASGGAAGIIVANRREHIFLLARGTKPRLRSSRVRSCRKNALGRSAVLAENSTCRPDGVAGRLNRTISSRTNCLDGRSDAAAVAAAGGVPPVPNGCWRTRSTGDGKRATH